MKKEFFLHFCIGLFFQLLLNFLRLLLYKHDFIYAEYIAGIPNSVPGILAIAIPWTFSAVISVFTFYRLKDIHRFSASNIFKVLIFNFIGFSIPVIILIVGIVYVFAHSSIVW